MKGVYCGAVKTSYFFLQCIIYSILPLYICVPRLTDMIRWCDFGFEMTDCVFKMSNFNTKPESCTLLSLHKHLFVALSVFYFFVVDKSNLMIEQLIPLSHSYSTLFFRCLSPDADQRPDIVDVSSRISDLMMKLIDSLHTSQNALERRAPPNCYSNSAAVT